MTIAGNVKHVATIAISIVIFNTPISTLNAIGTIVTILAVIWYSYIDYQEKRKGNDVNVLTILRPRNNVWKKGSFSISINRIASLEGSHE